MPRDDIFDFADHLGSATAAPAAPEEKELHLVVFVLDREEYAVPIELVREVVRVADITRVPHAPAHIRGVMNLRGRILPVVETRSRLGLQPIEPTPASRVVVVEINRRMVGLLVDGVGQVTRLGERQVTPPPDEVRSAAAEAVIGVGRAGQRLLMLLDLDRLLRSEALDSPSPTPP
jgi:purine-binding chemotaxis protein CheW